MGKIKFRNRDGEVLKTEHKYSKGPLYFIHEGENNSIFATAAEMCKNSDPLKSLWMRYYNDVIYNDFVFHEDRSKDLYEIVRNIENENIKKEFFTYLIKENYNPYEEMIPVNIPYINKIQNFLKEYYGYGRIFKANDKVILVMYEKKDDRLLSKIYLNYVDVIVLFKYSHTNIILKDYIKETYERLSEKESQWKLSGSGVIHTGGKKTGMDFKSQKLLERIF